MFLKNNHIIIINVLDIETFIDNNKKFIPYCMCFILNNKEYYLYKDKDKDNLILDFLIKLSNISESSYIEFFIHNLNFDGMLFIDSCFEKKIKVEIFSNKTNLYWLKIEFSKIIIKLRCSYKILPISVKKMGDYEGDKYKKLVFPYNFVNENNLDYIGKIPDKRYWENDDYLNYNNDENCFNLKKETIKYCLQDIKILHLSLSKIINIIENENVKNLLKDNYSTPSISFNLFFKKYNYKNIEKKIIKKNDEFIRSSYFGGRCEVFGNSKKEEIIKYFDFSGMYASCMKEKFHFGKSVYKIPKNFDEAGFYRIKYNSINMEFPILPYHGNNGKLLFLNGINYGTFWFEEIIYFIKNGGIVLEIISALVYENYDFIFDVFVNKFTELRKKGGYYNIFGKLMVNSFYGSTGLKDEENVSYISYNVDEVENMLKNLSIIKMVNVNNVYIVIIKIDEKYQSFFGKKPESHSKRNVSIASAITSKARIKLHSFILECIKDGGRVLYSDTDSVFASYNKKNNEININNKKWLDFYDDAVFISPKTYGLKKNEQYEIKIKGINKKNITFNELKNSFYSDKEISFLDQKIFNKSNFFLEKKNIEKKISLSKYDKRLFSKDKKYTYPLKTNTLN